MNILCVDDEPAVLGLVVSMCEELPQAPVVVGFTQPREALTWLGTHYADVALLDVDMPRMGGLDLARAIGEISPDTAIIFLTGYAEYAVDAFAIHASGYVLKPLSSVRLEEEVTFAVSGREGVRVTPTRLKVRTFGNFDVLVNDKSVSFARSQAKELLAYLVDRRGTPVTRREAFAALWEWGIYDRSKQKQLDVVIRTMRRTLDQLGVGEVVRIGHGTLRVVPELIDCDSYRFMDGDEQAIAAYCGEYMSSYPWARTTEGYLTRLKGQRK